MRHMTFMEGEVIFREGDPARTMYEVTEGAVDIISAFGTPDQTLLATLDSGQTFGEMGLVEAYPRSATAVAAKGGCSLIEIVSNEFADYLKDQPDKVLEIMRQMSGRLRETNEQYKEACQAVYEAIEAEKAGKRRSDSLMGRLSRMLHDLVH